MCGIFGAVATTGFFAPDQYGQFVTLTDRVRYRGPDDSGYVQLHVKGSSPESNGAFDVFLGSRRLSILDLSAAGHQPMTDGNGLWITFNGEIFNHVELRTELQRKGHIFRTGTDTEVILGIYREYGERGFAHLNGMWAFGIVDLWRRRIVLSRDRFSIKPLYVLQLGEKLYFGSEIKQLVPLLTCRELNLEVAAAFLAQGLLDHSRDTFVRHIKRVPPKTNLIIDLARGTITENVYWNYGEFRQSPPTHAADVLRALLTDSINIRLRSDVKVGVLLSGGLDSSTIAVTAHRLIPDGAQAYSVVSDVSRYSETAFIDELVSKTGMIGHKLCFRPFQVRETLDKALEHNDEPFTSFSVIAQYELFKAIKASSDATVLLSGQGGDEILLGYLKFFFFHLHQLTRQRRYVAAAGQILASLFRRTVFRQFRTANAWRYMPQFDKAHSVVAVPYARTNLGGRLDVRERQVLDIDHYSIPALAHYEDRMSMAHSLETRHPMLDHRLVDFAVSLPSDTKLQHGWPKYLLRDAFADLPESIRWRRDKQGFTTPEESWLKNDFSRTIRESFCNSALSQLGLINDPVFLALYNEFQHGRKVPSLFISRILIAESWARRFFGLRSAAA